jgi:hypothetical protein
MQSSSYSCHTLMKIEYSPQVFEKYSHIIYKENPSRECRVVPCAQTGRMTEMTELIVAFRN